MLDARGEGGLRAKLRAARLAAGHENAAKFALRVGVRPNTVYRIEAGKIRPSIDTLAAWARVCAVTTDSLLDLDPLAGLQ